MGNANRPMMAHNDGDCNQIAANRASSRSGGGYEDPGRYDSIKWKSNKEKKK